jgi:hypothetical protein
VAAAVILAVLVPARCLISIDLKSLNSQSLVSALRYPACDNSRKFPNLLRSRTIAVPENGETMDRRRSPRVEVQLPVQVWGMDAFGQAFHLTARVTNMSASGLVLQGIRRRIRVEEILDVRLGDDKAQFRVIWVGNSTSKVSGEIGLKRITAQPFLPESVLVYCSQSAAAC